MYADDTLYCTPENALLRRDSVPDVPAGEESKIPPNSRPTCKNILWEAVKQKMLDIRKAPFHAGLQVSGKKL